MPASSELVEDMGLGPPKALGDTCSPRPSPKGPGGYLLSPSIPRRPWGHLLSLSIPRRPWGTPALPVRPLLLWPVMRDLSWALGVGVCSCLSSGITCVLCAWPSSQVLSGSYHRSTE